MWPRLPQGAGAGALLVQSTQDWLIEQNIQSDITLDINNGRLGLKGQSRQTDSQLQYKRVRHHITYFNSQVHEPPINYQTASTKKLQIT